MRWTAEASEDALRTACAEVPTRRFTPEVYLPRLRADLREFGLTRLSDITGLDKVGWPVAQATRPWSRSNAVTQGKGPTLPAAAVGAVLECLEMAAGEDVARLPSAAPGDPGPWQALACGTPWDIEDWTRAWRVDGGGWGAVPRAIVDTDFSTGAAAEAAPILRVSIGLGAGADLGSAIWHGLLEAIEGDARIRAEATGHMVRVEGGGAAMDTALAGGLRVVLWQMPCKGGMVAIKASVMQEPSATALPLPAVGYAARRDGASAVEAAVSEALQARLAVISGAREDLTQAVYRHGASADILIEEWRRHAQAPVAPIREGTPATTPDEVAAEVGPVFVVVLHNDTALPLTITRVVAPALITDPLMLASDP